MNCMGTIIELANWNSSYTCELLEKIKFRPFSEVLDKIKLCPFSEVLDKNKASPFIEVLEKIKFCPFSEVLPFHATQQDVLRFQWSFTISVKFWTKWSFTLSPLVYLFHTRIWGIRKFILNVIILYIIKLIFNKAPNH